ncbi:MAG: methionine synthase, partial [Gammaproteobacteria bacterium]|nr:methionine synthase [Gammaproteobacteria bacterium]
MHYSNDRILVTHVGSLPRSPALLDMLGRMEAGEVVDRGEFRSEVLAGLREAVREQAAAGIDIAGDGELPRIGFSFYAKDRMTGFGGEAQRGTVTDFAKFPGYAELVVSRSAGQSNAGKSASVWATPECVDEVRYDPELAQAREELDLFEDALKAEAEASGNFTGTFVTAVTPGILATTLLRNPENPAYARDEDYVFALARELRREYEYIVSRGHILQLDAPDLALERQILFVDRPLEEFQERMEVHVAALNEALENIPRDKVRMHV